MRKAKVIELVQSLIEANNSIREYEDKVKLFINTPFQEKSATHGYVDKKYKLLFDAHSHIWDILNALLEHLGLEYKDFPVETKIVKKVKK